MAHASAHQQSDPASESVFISSATHVHDEAPGDGDRRSLHPALRRAVSAAIVFSILVFPLFFGGVHPTTYLLERMLIFSALLFFWFRGHDRLRDTFKARSSARAIAWYLLAIVAYILCQGAVLSIGGTPHPILGASSLLASTDSFREGVLTLATFVALFVITRAWLGNLTFKANTIVRIILLSGMVVSLTALSHWFYDTGKLFWIFEPENSYTSFRARWPFVNANHLGHFLLPVFFIALGAIQLTASELFDVVLTTHRSNKRSWGLLLQSSRVQNRLIRLGLLSLLVVVAAVAIIGSLSRGAWLGTSIGLLVFLLLSRLCLAGSRANNSSMSTPFEGNTTEHQHSAETVDSGATQAPDPRPRRSRARKNAPLSSENFSDLMRRSSRASTVAFSLLSVLLIYFFLYGRGSELFADRLQYGLLYSLEDMRWQLYRDTARIFSDHWLLGIGLGGWAHFHPQYMQPLMSGINPVYLHSDPYQLAVELGAPGAFLVLGGVALLTVAAVVALRKLGQSESGETRGAAIMLLSISCGLLALCTASLVDFPFRIPAIASLTSVILALLSFYLDKHRNPPNGNGHAAEPFQVIQQSN